MMIGTPKYEETTGSLTFPDLDFDLRTTNVLLKAYDKYDHGKLCSELRNHASFDLRNEEKRLKRLFEEATNRTINGLVSTTKTEVLQLASIANQADGKTVNVVFKISGLWELALPQENLTVTPAKIRRITAHCDIFREDKETAGAIKVTVSRNGVSSTLIEVWGHDKEWKDYSLHEISSDKSFTDEPVKGRYRIDLQVIRGNGIDMDTEVYLVIEDDKGGMSLSPVYRHYWKNNEKHKAWEFPH